MFSDIKDLYPDFATWPTVPNGTSRTDNGHPHNWEREALARLILRQQAAVVFEFGTFMGATANYIASIPCVTKVLTLNIPPKERPLLSMRDIDLSYTQNTARDILDGKVTQLWGDSTAFDFVPYAQAVDLAWVMGAHSPEYIASDLRSAFGMLRPGGTVVLHAGDIESLVAARLYQYDLYVIGERMAVVREQTGFRA